MGLADLTYEPEKYHSGKDDNLQPLESLDLSKVSDFDELTKAMSLTSFSGRSLGEAVDILCEMVKDNNTFVIGTFAGAMTGAKMGLLICEMIDRGMLQAVVTTGALMSHGLVEGLGMHHFKYRANGVDDKDLLEKGYDRIYDTLELEKNLDEMELLLEPVLNSLNDETISSHELNYHVGKYLHENNPPERKSILKSAFLRSTPVYIPAFSDSVYGMNFSWHNHERKLNDRQAIVYDPFRDLDDLAHRIIKSKKKLGIFTIGGGVPRNWAQEIAPYIYQLYISYGLIKDSNKKNLSYNKEFKKKYIDECKPIRYQYGIRICPEPAHWGGLSGCTYSEGVSWGKFIPESEGGKYAEVYSDATVAWPLILKAAIQRLEKKYGK